MKKADRIELNRLKRAARSEVAKREAEEKKAAEPARPGSIKGSTRWQQVEAAGAALPPYLWPFVEDELAIGAPQGWVFVTIPGVSRFAVGTQEEYYSTKEYAWKAVSYGVFSPELPGVYQSDYPDDEYVRYFQVETFPLDRFELAVGVGMKYAAAWEAAPGQLAAWIEKAKDDRRKTEEEARSRDKRRQQVLYPVTTSEEVRKALEASWDALKDSLTFAQDAGIHAQAVATAWLGSVMVETRNAGGGGNGNDYD